MTALLIVAGVVLVLLLVGICRVSGDSDQDEEDTYGVDQARRS